MKRLLLTLAIATLVASSAFAEGEKVTVFNLVRAEAEFMDRVKQGDSAAVKSLPESGMNPDLRDKTGLTALMAAAGNGQTETVQTLLDRGADVNAKGKNGETALKLARDQGHAEIIQLLAQAESKNGELVIELSDFPTGPDAKWKYEVTLAAKPDQVIEHWSQMVDCSTCAELDQVCWKASPGKIAMYGSKEAKLPFRSFHFPLQMGTSWEERVGCGAGGRDVTTAKATVVAEEMITVPAGSFQTLKIIEKSGDQENCGGESHWWIAPGIGVIKEQVISSRGTTTDCFGKF